MAQNTKSLRAILRVLICLRVSRVRIVRGQRHLEQLQCQFASILKKNQHQGYYLTPF